MEKLEVKDLFGNTIDFGLTRQNKDEKELTDGISKKGWQCLLFLPCESMQTYTHNMLAIGQSLSTINGLNPKKVIGHRNSVLEKESGMIFLMVFYAERKRVNFFRKIKRSIEKGFPAGRFKWTASQVMAYKINKN